MTLTYSIKQVATEHYETKLFSATLHDTKQDALAAYTGAYVLRAFIYSFQRKYLSMRIFVGDHVRTLRAINTCLHPLIRQRFACILNERF